MRKWIFLLILPLAPLFSDPGHHFLLMGAPGSGKGTLTQYLFRQEPTIHLCMGDILREEVKRGTEDGLLMKELIERGELVPEEIVFRLFKKRFLDALEKHARIIVDGLVQSEENVEFFDRLLEEIGLEEAFTFVYLNVCEETAKERLLNRRICRECKKSFPPDYCEEDCDRCRGSVEKRPDDNEKAIRRRIERFFSKTVVLVEHYRQKERFVEIDAESSLVALLASYRELFNE